MSARFIGGVALVATLGGCGTVTTRRETTTTREVEVWHPDLVDPDGAGGVEHDRVDIVLATQTLQYEHATVLRRGDALEVWQGGRPVGAVPLADTLLVRGERVARSEHVTRDGAADDRAWIVAGIGMGLSALLLAIAVGAE